MINVSRSSGQFNRFNSTGASEFVTRSVAQGASKSEELVAIIEDPGDVRLPPLGREALARAWCANRAALLRRAKPGTRPGWADRLLARRRQTSCWSPWLIGQPASPGHCSGTSVSTNRYLRNHTG